MTTAAMFFNLLLCAACATRCAETGRTLLAIHFSIWGLVALASLVVTTAQALGVPLQ